MEKSKNVFIIDSYDKFTTDKVVSVFRINDNWWAIKEVPLFWGVPQRNKIEDDEYTFFQIYETLEEAQQYVSSIKRLEGLT